MLGFLSLLARVGFIRKIGSAGGGGGGGELLDEGGLALLDENGETLLDEAT